MNFQNILIKKIKREVYIENSNGFYVYAPKKQYSNTSSILKYITRYVGRPVIVQSRILYYDGTFVNFFYDIHEDGKRIVETLHVYDFIKKLIIHIPDRYFNMIIYYGIYAMSKNKTSH